MSRPSQLGSGSAVATFPVVEYHQVRVNVGATEVPGERPVFGM